MKAKPKPKRKPLTYEEALRLVDQGIRAEMVLTGLTDYGAALRSLVEKKPEWFTALDLVRRRTYRQSGRSKPR